jgi:hypothetical protein
MLYAAFLHVPQHLGAPLEEVKAVFTQVQHLLKEGKTIMLQ